jgi:quinol monooxygenase YgiN
MTARDRTNAVHLHEVYVDGEAYELHARSSRLANVRERYKDLIVGRTITICNL